MSEESQPGKMRLRLPATSANLGPGFDAVAIALNFYLHIEAERAGDFSITATGRDAERCARLEDNLVLDLYSELMAKNGRPAVPLAIRMQNEIPLGMGCGSSAAGRLAAIALANHFGGLKWQDDRILAEASVLEGHPDNVAACWLGGFVAASENSSGVHVARVIPPADWRAIVVLPNEPLATSKARAVLPSSYGRDDVVANLQAVSMLGLAFGQGRCDLLHAAMSDRIHQPYRAAICPQLPELLPLAGSHGIIGVALSGAGPAVLVVVDGEQALNRAAQSVREALAGMSAPELLVCRFEPEGANQPGSR
jgi:homoserine kinase